MTLTDAEISSLLLKIMIGNDIDDIKERYPDLITSGIQSAKSEIEEYGVDNALKTIVSISLTVGYRIRKAEEEK